jgi:hypothetical protein
MNDRPLTRFVICPQCHVLNDTPVQVRSAGGFCSSCDYPLFYAHAADGGRRDGPLSERSARRRPGVQGHAYDGRRLCPKCGEPNRSDAKICHRDRAALDDDEPAAAPAAAEPEPLPLPFWLLDPDDLPPAGPASPRTTEEQWALVLLVLAVVPLVLALIVLL